MKYIDLLGQQLKSYDVIDVLECHDLDVIYAFDRLSENQPDEYWVASKAEGIQMRFNEDQTLDLIFFYIQSEDDFLPCKNESLGVPVFEFLSSARDYAAKSGLPVTEGEADILGVYRKWIRIDFGSHMHHSEFCQDMLHLVTITHQPKAQQAMDTNPH